MLDINENPCWLTPGEQRDVLSALLGFNLLKWDNNRKLPLKSGGHTDVYANLRDCRSTAGASDFLAECFENPMRRLRLDRFVEMPSALSGVAGLLQTRLGKPYVTIRDNPKPGRVSDAELVGQLVPGENTGFLDDVITDGETKIPAWDACRRRGVTPSGLVVMVDRQQGWRQKFSAAGINLPVWAGMTLHDVRSFLIGEGAMQRCNPGQEKKNPLIIALDGKSWEEVLPIIDRLRPSGCILKANDLLTTDSLENVVRKLGVYGRVMVDPKWHDIKNTVANYCARLRKTPPWAVTIHASGGREMIKAAVDTLNGTPTIVLAVTVLTSLKDECEEIYGRMPLSEVQLLAKVAWDAGARGFVCSTEEAGELRKLYPSATIVIPALRSPGADAAEQKRTGTFEGAQEIGGENSFFVGGRQFMNAADPVAEVERVMKDELKIAA